MFKVRRKPDHVGVFRQDGDIGEGEPIVVAGYPEKGTQASELSVSAGVARAMPSGGNRLVAVTAPIQPGISGAPLLDLGGNVAGMVMAKAEAVKIAGGETIPKDTGFALSARVVKAFLNGQSVAYETAADDRPLTPAAAGDRGRAFTVSVECR